MTSVNFKDFFLYTDIAKRQRVRCDIRREISNLLYSRMHGIEALNLALAIYRSDGEVSVTDDELRLLRTAVERFGTPALIDAFNEQVHAVGDAPEADKPETVNLA